MLENIQNAIEHYCAYQERCHEEVRKKLIQLGCYGSDLEDAITHLIEHDFLNEERYAKLYARSKFNQNKWGKNKITYQLHFKKISQYCIQKGLKEIDEQKYKDTLQDLFIKKATSLDSEKNLFAKKQKIKNYLMNKGYEPDLIYTLLETL